MQDFPVDYVFKGTQGQVHQQIGNAVPVRLGRAMAGAVAEYFERQATTGEILLASYFCGAGGLDLGFEQASMPHLHFKTGFTTDIEPWAEQTVTHNRPAWHFHRADIRELSPQQVQEALGAKPKVIIGGPPCQPFSVAGKQKATQDPLGTLYRDYIRHIDFLQPEIVVMENVYGLAQVKSINMVQEIYRSFEQIGYQVTHRELLAADYGAPQKRRRLFFVAAKNLQYFAFPQPTHCASEKLLGLPCYQGAGQALLVLPPPCVKPHMA